MAKKIEHLVVLMMENRSFDHMFGFLKSASYPINGLDGTETNPDTLGAPVRVSPDARYGGDFTPDPGHDFISVNEQIFGNSQGTGAGPFMKGFVKAYQGKTGNVAKSHNIMRCFSPGRLPALTTLAQEYAICDRWFASVPGPTLPNRAFAFGATSQGRVDMNPQYVTLKTIFQLLDENKISSKLYYTDWTLGLAIGYIIQNARKFLFFFDDFIKDCKKNRLPAFSFIEPRFNDLSDRGEFFPASDQHPDHNVFQGEKVIKAVYDAITSNKETWESTLFVITYDEHGGLFDHVRPPATVSPDGKTSGVPPFTFDRLGVRVPAVLVSPFIPRGTILNQKDFDHTSIIATASKLFIKNSPKPWLTERDRQANTFEDCLTLSTPRPGKVSIPQPRDVRSESDAATARRAMTASVAAAAEIPAEPLSEFQSIMLQQALAIESGLPRTRQTATLVSSIKTEQETAQYLAAVRARIAQSRNGHAAKKRSTTKKKTASPARKASSAKKASSTKKASASKRSTRKAGATKAGSRKTSRKRS